MRGFSMGYRLIQGGFQLSGCPMPTRARATAARGGSTHGERIGGGEDKTDLDSSSGKRIGRTFLR